MEIDNPILEKETGIEDCLNIETEYQMQHSSIMYLYLLKNEDTILRHTSTTKIDHRENMWFSCNFMHMPKSLKTTKRRIDWYRSRLLTTTNSRSNKT